MHQVTVARESGGVDRAVLAFVTACALWKFSLPLRAHGHLLSYAQDDFFYYLKTAQNLAAGHGSTFDGITQTNGYHPLYFLLWTAVSFSTLNIRAVFECLWLLDVVSSVCIFLAVRLVFSRVTADPLLRNAFALCVLVPCIATISFQMETTLAMPLGFVFLATGFVPPPRYTAARCALLGLLGALTMLARLDAAFLVFTFITGLLCTPESRRSFVPANMASFAATALPLPLLYLWINHHFFHGWLPVSGAAKQLRHGWLPDSREMLASFAGFTLVQFAVAAICLVLAVLVWKYLRPWEKQLCIAGFLFPVLFYGVEVVISAWKLWGWYMYAVRFADLASGLIIAVAFVRVLPERMPAVWKRMHSHSWLAPAWLGVCCLALIAARYRIDPVMFEIEDAASHLSAFSQSHPGQYAMGDRAGMFGYLSSASVLQSEGLMMDYGYLQHIRHGDDLRSTLLGYGVRYYGAFVGADEAGQKVEHGCLVAAEPAIAGRDALRMHGTFCEAPIYRYTGEKGEYRVYSMQ